MDDGNFWVAVFILFVMAMCAWADASAKKKLRDATTFNPPNIYGAATWASDETLDKAGCFRKKGFPVGFSLENDREIWFDNPQKPHGLIFGGTGEGKTTNIDIPACLEFRQSLVAPDLDFELTLTCMEQRRNYGRMIICDTYNCLGKLPRGIERGFFNVMDRLDPANEDTFGPMSMMIAKAAIYQHGSERDARFWYGGATQGFQAAVMAVKAHEPKEKQTLARVAEVIIEDYFGYMKKIAATTRHPRVRSACLRFANPDDKIRSLPEVLETLKNETAYLLEPPVMKAMSKSTFSYKECGDKVTTVFIPLPSNMDYKPQFKFNLTCAFGLLMGEAKRAKVQTLVLIEEFYAVRPDDMDVIYATARKKNVVILSCMQGLDQLTEIYPKTSSSFINNSGLVAWLAADDVDSSTLVSNYCGDIEVYSRTKSLNSDPLASEYRPHLTEGISQQGRKLILPQEVRHLPPDRQILWLDSVDAPVLSKRRPYFRTARKRIAGKSPYAPKTSFWG